jgi:uncharacterized coiled-coil DUF342 family protein
MQKSEDDRRRLEEAEQQFLEQALQASPEVKRQLEELRGKGQAARARLEEVKQQADETGRELAELAGRQRQEIEGHAAEVRRYIQEVQHEVDEVRGPLQTLRTLAPEAEEFIRSARSQAEALRGELEEVRREYEAAREELRQVQEEVRTARQGLAGARKEVEASQAETREAVQEARQDLREQSAAPLQPGTKMVVGGKKLLGVTVDETARVVEVVPATPAEKVGLQAGDVITSLNGRPIGNAEDLCAAVGPVPVGEEVTVGVKRGEEVKEVTARLEEAVVAAVTS